MAKWIIVGRSSICTIGSCRTDFIHLSSAHVSCWSIVANINFSSRISIFFKIDGTTSYFIWWCPNNLRFNKKNILMKEYRVFEFYIWWTERHFCKIEKDYDSIIFLPFLTLWSFFGTYWTKRKTSLVIFLWKRRTSSVVFLANIISSGLI